MKLISFCFIVLMFSSCESDCVTCKHEDSTMTDLKFCEDSGSTFTDSSGNTVSFDELIEGIEGNGYKCD